MEELPELEVEREHQPDGEDREADDERAGPGQEWLEEAGQEPADPATAPVRHAAAARSAGSPGASSPSSDLDHDREDHRPPLGLLVQVARHAVLDLALEEGDLADVVARVLDGLEDA